ncbi:SRPBCC domain-containing protein [Cohnella nanjingensis]|uniref:SRPBCC domain-containing protein n=2 Tax=Cohnella nanjingensis TaxID=1387779 RepID=A0A7X0RN21_9BACL|nr:SRPBCC domain-containing protein [Cohnella nanjingensis]
MLIRRSAREVYEAIVDPAITTLFWFTKSSGRLEADANIRWDWEMYGVGTDVRVLELEPEKRIVFEWSAPAATRVEWTLTPHGDIGAYVEVVESGFHGDGDALVHQALDSTGGFTMVLCAMKAWLEHGIVLHVVADKAPPQDG